MEFSEVVKARRSSNNFDDTIKIEVSELKAIFDEVKLAPSAFNLQPAEYYAVLNADQKAALREASGGQYKVTSASAVIVVTADRHAYEQTEKLGQGAVMLGMMSADELAQSAKETAAYYENNGEEFMKFDAVRNASLSAMIFMLAAKNRGWDTCPLSYDDKAVRQILSIPQSHEIVFMITLGKEKTTHPRPRGYRKPMGEFVHVLT